MNNHDFWDSGWTELSPIEKVELIGLGVLFGATIAGLLLGCLLKTLGVL